MPKLQSIVLKFLRRIWFPVFILVIFLVYLVNQQAAIWITVIAIGIFALSYVPHLIKRFRLVRFMKGYYMIEDDTITEHFKKPLRIIQERMFEILQSQQNKKEWQVWKLSKKWLIVFLNKHYIFYHQQTIDKFKGLYAKGCTESEILDKLKDKDLRTKAEVKSIKDALIKNKKIIEREPSAKEQSEQKRLAK